MVTETPIPNPIASAGFIWVRGDGSELPIEARVGRPYLVAGTEWACPCAIEGFDGAYPDIRGEGSLQALSLAVGLILQRLGHLLESGGRLLDPDDRHTVDQANLAVMFGKSVGSSIGRSG
jgi:hypothetical protein